MGFYTSRDGLVRCDHCGAPPAPGLAACLYCKAAYPNVAAGVCCPRCNAVNKKAQTLCGQCNLEITRACVFCQQVSPIDLPVCTRCREPFDGAEARLAAKVDAEKRRQYMQLAGKGLGAAVTIATNPTGAALLGKLFDAITDD
ncbi:MAG: hypothetical protein JNK72_20285 [Myxococcales bacterium]|nr:hypothetical protein [Myxococcales bacterium]